MNIPAYLTNSFRIACKGDSTVLLAGGTGTGKTSLAQEIHNHSSRQRGPFVSVNLATLHEGTLESELFGHERGSFTGADQRRVGRLALANGGTLFLDEIGELPPRLQARLLEFLQSRQITPVGGNQGSLLDVRVIAATHRNLSASVSKGEFREDLFHRLNVIFMHLKALRERIDEFSDLTQVCLRDVCLKLNRPEPAISTSVSEFLEAYSWPGNIRELRNILEYAVLSNESHEIKKSDLPPWFLASSNSLQEHSARDRAVLGVAEIPLTLDFHGTWVCFEKEYLKRALSRNGGRVSRTARQIGMSKATLIRRVRAYGLQGC